MTRRGVNVSATAGATSSLRRRRPTSHRLYESAAPALCFRVPGRPQGRGSFRLRPFSAARGRLGEPRGGAWLMALSMPPGSLHTEELGVLLTGQSLGHRQGLCAHWVQCLYFINKETESAGDVVARERPAGQWQRPPSSPRLPAPHLAKEASSGNCISVDRKIPSAAPSPGTPVPPQPGHGECSLGTSSGEDLQGTSRGI